MFSHNMMYVLWLCMTYIKFKQAKAVWNLILSAICLRVYARLICMHMLSFCQIFICDQKKTSYTFFNIFDQTLLSKNSNIHRTKHIEHHFSSTFCTRCVPLLVAFYSFFSRSFLIFHSTSSMFYMHVYRKYTLLSHPHSSGIFSFPSVPAALYSTSWANSFYVKCLWVCENNSDRNSARKSCDHITFIRISYWTIQLLSWCKHVHTRLKHKH